VAAPPSKSLSVRALLLAAMIEEETTVTDLLDCDDTRYVADAIRKIGFEVRGSFREGLTIGARQTMSANEVELFVGNAGAAMRFLGWLAVTPGRFILRGESRMHERPIAELVDALRMLETEIEYLEQEGFPPIRLRGRRMRGGFIAEVEGERSSQFVSAMMLAGATLPDGIGIRILSLLAPYVDLTAGILRDFGVAVREDGYLFRIRGRARRREVRRRGRLVGRSLVRRGAVLGEMKVGNAPDSAQGDRRFGDPRGDGARRARHGRVTVRSGALAGGTRRCNATPTPFRRCRDRPSGASPVRSRCRLRIRSRPDAASPPSCKLGASVEEAGRHDDAPRAGSVSVTIDTTTPDRDVLAIGLAAAA
jgi:3-phosphoshikimate 1-carboxyvinyltransferase